MPEIFSELLMTRPLLLENTGRSRLPLEVASKEPSSAKVGGLLSKSPK